YSKIKFQTGDVTHLEKNKDLNSGYDIIFTDRCLINLNSKKLQMTGVEQISKKLKPGGYFLMLENSVQNYTRQNEARISVGLPARKPAKFNLFIDEHTIIPHIKKTMNLVSVNDFGSLYDVVLYVLTPLINNGTHDYDHPLVKAA